MEITIETLVKAPPEAVWAAWNEPADIEQWYTASPDWGTKNCKVDLQEGGAFSWRMEYRDGSMGFDFAGTYTRIVAGELIEFILNDERPVKVTFAAGAEGVTVRQTFTAESETSGEQQRQGWQLILANFARFVEAKGAAGTPHG